MRLRLGARAGGAGLPVRCGGAIEDPEEGGSRSEEGRTYWKGILPESRFHGNPRPRGAYSMPAVSEIFTFRKSVIGQTKPKTLIWQLLAVVAHLLLVTD